MRTEAIKQMKQRMKISIVNAGFTVEKFCLLYGVPRRTLYRYSSPPSVRDIVIISNKCNVTTDYLLKG